MNLKIFFIVLLLSSSALAITPWDAHAISEAVSQGSWENSETIFRDLQSRSLPKKQLLEVDYNLGVSLYNQEKFQEALPYFQKAAKSETDRALKAKALYNQGNTHFKLEQLEEAKKAYQQALLSNPEDDDARYNIEVILEKEKQDQQNQQNQEDQEDQEDQSDSEQEQDKDQNQDQDSKDEQNQDQSEDKQEGKDQDQQESEGEQNKDGRQQPDEGQQQPQEGSNQEQKMTEEERKAAREEAERARLLDYFNQQEKEGRPASQVRPQAPPVRGKTW